MTTSNYPKTVTIHGSGGDAEYCAVTGEAVTDPYTNEDFLLAKIDLKEYLEYWLHLDSRTLNVALFIPLGLTLGLLARGAARWAILVFGLALPWIVEGLQSVLPFDRDPQSIDLADNTTGFVVGYAAGLLIMSLVASMRGRAPTTPSA